MSKVLVTGVSGYIGGQTALMLKDQGHDVYGIDVVVPSDNISGVLTEFCRGDIIEFSSLDLISKVVPDAIIHCAGTSLVGPSVKHPEDYYHNNFVKALVLLNYLINANLSPRIIFSSSAAVYGDPVMTPCNELDPPLPISPYGESKYMVEMMLKSYHLAYNVDYVAFRYFNAAGADSQGRHGQAPGGTHIISRVLESIRDDQEFVLYGDTMSTADGTCIRDYVHVEDIAAAHILALDKTKVEPDIYNLGNETGVSNKEIMSTAERITQRTLKSSTTSARPGDPVELRADPSKFKSASGWTAKYSVDDMIQHAWTWYNR